MNFDVTEDWLTARARASPQHPAIVLLDRRSITFEELDNQVTQLAVHIASQVKSDQHIALLPTNTLNTIVQILAIMRLGAVLIPLNIRLTSPELKTQLHLSNAQWIIPPDDQALHHKLKAIDVSLLYPVETKSLTALSPHSMNLNKPFAIVHTSGTSAIPKGVVLTYGNIFYSAVASGYRIGILPNDRWLSVLPLYHIGGLSIILRSLLYGTTVELLPHFDIEQVNRALTESPITLVSLVPTMLHRLLEAKHVPWNPKLRLILLGGAAPSDELVQRCIEEAIPLATTYGLTEASSQVATTTLEQVSKKPGSVGRPLIFNTVHIVDEQHNQVPTGHHGEIIVKGPTIMQAYYHNTEVTQKALRNGDLYTGDIGYFDDDGDLWIVQRRTDLIVTGGENVYPAEVEAIIRQYTTVRDVAVLGLPHSEWGQQVAAAIIAKETITEQEILNFTRQHLAGYKIPRVIKFVDNLPKTASGKIQRSELRKLFE